MSETIVNIKYSTCPLCEANCGIEVHVDSDKNEIIKIKGDLQDPISKGYMCVKGMSLGELHQDPDRLRMPVIRTGNEWKEVSWPEAIQFAAKGLNAVQKKHGKNSVAIFQGNPLGHSADAIWYYWLFTKVMGTNNIYSSASLDQLPHMMVTESLYGNLGMFSIPDVDRTDFMLIIGANPVISNGSIMSAPNIRKRLVDVRERGGKVVVIDPRKTETAHIADQHVPIIPGNDVYLLLAFVHVLFETGKVELGKLTSIVDGTNAIKSLVQPYTPESVAGRVGIPAATIRNLVDAFCSAKAACIYPRVGASTQLYGTLTHWLCHSIAILTGNLDKEGAMMFTKPAIDFIRATNIIRESGNFGQYQSRVSGYNSFRGEFPMAALMEEMQTPGADQVKGFVSVAGNPVLSSPGGNKLGKQLEELDFMVSIDVYKNETTRHANVILPPCFTLENYRFEAAFPIMSVRNKIKYSPPVLKKQDPVSDGIILKMLSKQLKKGPWWTRLFLHLLPFKQVMDFNLRMGFYGGKYIPFRKGLNLKQIKQHPHGMDLGPLVPMLPKRLFTKNKRIHLAPELFISAMETLKKEAPDKDETTKRSYYLIGRRQLRSNNSWYFNLPGLTKKLTFALLIHPEDAEQEALKDGDRVVLFTSAGEITVPVSITDDMRPGVLSLPHGWGHTDPNADLSHAKQHPGASINDLIDPASVEKLSGTSVLNGFKVWLKKAP